LPKQKRVAQGRRHSRELAVQLLYSLSIRPEQNLDECLDTFTSWGFASDASLDDAVKNYMISLVRGVWHTRADIDGIMRRVVTGWRLERMVAVDRAVLRLAIFEGFLEKKVPIAVAISEAVELAQAFGTEDSGKFVNGVLAKILRFMEGENTDDGEKKDGHDGKRHAVSIAKDSTDS